MAEFNFVTYKNFEPLTDEWKTALSIALEALYSALCVFELDIDYTHILCKKYDIKLADLFRLSEYNHDSDRVSQETWLKAQRMVEVETAKMFSLPQPLQEEGSQTVTAADVMDHVKGWKCCTAKGNTDDLKQAVDAYNDSNGFKSASPINLNIQHLIGTLVVVVSETNLPDEIAEKTKIALETAIRTAKASSQEN